MLLKPLRSIPLPLILASVFFFAAAFFATRFPDAPGASAGSYVSTFLIATPTVVALARYLGPRRAALSLLALAAFGYAIETTGVATGLPYGRFFYGDALGPKVFGLVPFLLPVTYVPLVIGAVAASWSPDSRGKFSWILRAAVLLTLVDGVLDPGATLLGFWTWPEGGPYYGVPISNFAGWLLSSTLAAALLLATSSWRATPRPGLLDSTILALAFWTGVATLSGLVVPFLLGAALYAYLLHRRSRLAARHPKADAPTRYPTPER